MTKSRELENLNHTTNSLILKSRPMWPDSSFNSHSPYLKSTVSSFQINRITFQQNKKMNEHENRKLLSFV